MVVEWFNVNRRSQLIGLDWVRQSWLQCSLWPRSVDLVWVITPEWYRRTCVVQRTKQAGQKWIHFTSPGQPTIIHRAVSLFSAVVWFVHLDDRAIVSPWWHNSIANDGEDSFETDPTVALSDSFNIFYLLWNCLFFYSLFSSTIVVTLVVVVLFTWIAIWKILKCYPRGCVALVWNSKRSLGSFVRLLAWFILKVVVMSTRH